MTTNRSLGEQLVGMMNAIRRYDDCTSSTCPQSSELSFMTLVWPLLPLLPQEPPKPVLDLLKEPDKCDICGVAEGKPMLTCTKSTTGILSPLPPTGTTLRSRFACDGKTPLDKLMTEIEKKMDETLSSIETTTIKHDELDHKHKELTQTTKLEMTDAEMLEKLNSLVNEKANREKRVKSLETKERQLKESLLTAINWAKSIETKDKELNDKKTTQKEEEGD